MFTESEIIELLDNFDQAEQYQELIKFVDSLRPEQKTAKILSLQARACNNVYWQNTIPENRHFAERALAILTDLEDELSHDATWHFRIAYSHFYLDNKDKAKAHFQAFFDKTKDNVAQHFLQIIDFATSQNLDLITAQDKFYQQNFNTDDLAKLFVATNHYSKNEHETFVQAVQERFGEIDGVFHTEGEYDVFLIKPTDELPVYTLITCGMGASAMNVPDDEVPKFSELLIHLPPDWDFENPQNMWIVDCLQQLAKIPHRTLVFFASGHTVPFQQKIENVPFDCYLLLETTLPIDLTDKKSLSLYHVILLYPEERLFRLNNGLNILLECLDDIDLPFPPILDLKRPNSCADYQPMALGVDSLNDVYWQFNNRKFTSFGDFWSDFYTYHQTFNQTQILDNFSPTAIASFHEIYIVYRAYLTNTNVLNENETLLSSTNFDEDEMEVEILLKVGGLDEDHIGVLEILYCIHQSLSNKDLGDHVFFEGLELDEDLTGQYQKTVYRLLLGS